MAFITSRSFNGLQNATEAYLRSPGVSLQHQFEREQHQTEQDQPHIQNADDLSFGSESFLTPYPAISPLPSPPSIHKPKRRLVKSLILDEDEALMADLMIPSFDTTSNPASPIRHLKRRPFVLNIRKRLGRHREPPQAFQLQATPEHSPTRKLPISPVYSSPGSKIPVQTPPSAVRSPMNDNRLSYNNLLSPYEPYDQNLEERPRKKMKRRNSNAATAA